MFKRAVLVVGAVGAATAVATADDVFQIDINALSARASGAFSTSFTGTLDVFNSPASPDFDGDAEILDVLIDSTPQGTGGAATADFFFEMSISFVGGSITSGALTVKVDEAGSENTYTASISPTSGSSIIEFAPGIFTIGGLTFDGAFSDPSGTFLGVDITRWGSIPQVPGRFSDIEFSPNGSFEDADTDVDVFVLIPLPSGAAMAGLGLLALGGRWRR